MQRIPGVVRTDDGHCFCPLSRLEGAGRTIIGSEERDCGGEEDARHAVSRQSAGNEEELPAETVRSGSGVSCIVCLFDGSIFQLLA